MIDIKKDIPRDILLRFPVLNVEAKNKNLKAAYDVAHKYAPVRIAEIGVRCGYSAWAMLQAVPDAEFFGFDNYSYKPRQVCECAQEYLLEGYNWKVVETDTQKNNKLYLFKYYPNESTVLSAPNPIHSIDLFHVDGEHSYMGCYHDLELAFASLSKDGIILVDDTILIPAVGQACIDFIWVHDEYEIEIQDDDFYGTWVIRPKQNRLSEDFKKSFV